MRGGKRNAKKKKKYAAKGGGSALVPYLHKEGGPSRHARRLNVALERVEGVRDTLTRWGGTLKLLNEGDLWRVMLNGHTAEWQPSVGTLVFDGRAGYIVKVLDTEQLLGYLAEYMRQGWRPWEKRKT